MLATEASIIEKCEEELATYHKGEGEITQHLIELGYLPVLLTNSLTGNQKQKARQQFERDLLASKLFTEEEIATEKRFNKQHFLKYFLRRLTDIDEGIIFNALPKPGEKNLKSRVIHYRLDIFGLWEHPVDMPFSHTTLLQISQLEQFGKCTSLEAINLLADIEKFTRLLLSVYSDETFILIFYSPRVSKATIEKHQRVKRFGAQLKEDFGEKTGFFKYLQRNIFKLNENKIDYGFLEKECKDKKKRLLTRLIQIHQWQEGFYDGLLDSDLGDISIESIVQSIEAYNEATGKNIRPYRVLTYLGKGFFMFNALFFLQEYMIEDRASDDSEVWSSLANEVKNADTETQNKFETSLQKLKTDINSKPEPEEKRGVLKRVYYGLKKLFKKALRFIKKLFKWVLSRANKIWGFLKRLFFVFFEKVHTGLVAFADGLKFIFGRKVIFSGKEHRFIASKCSIDGDISTLAIGASQELVHQHIKESRYQFGAMGFSLALTSNVLKIVIQSFNVISWPFILFTIINSFKTISESYKKLEIVKS